MSETDAAHSLPAVHALHLIELVKRWNVTAQQLFEGLDPHETDLADPNARLSVSTIIALIERARTLTREPAIGVMLGLHMRASAHGYLGFAAMTASTAREAIELAVKFAPTRTTAVSLRLQEHDELASLFIDEHADFGAARDAIMLAVLVGIWQIGNDLTGRELRGTADVAFAEPAYYARFSGFAPKVRFDQPATQLVFDRTILDLPLTMADPAALRLAREQCERALAALGVEGRLVPRVRGMIAKEGGGVHSLEEIAAQLHLSPRTLKRRLAAESAAYSSLVEEQQREHALLLLRSRDLTLDEIAARVGYSDATNFTRAFRRWTGKTPAAFRKSALG
jgi:AraC-like DNA-binding protein